MSRKMSHESGPAPSGRKGTKAKSDPFVVERPDIIGPVVESQTEVRENTKKMLAATDPCRMT
jgi:hypothetical protein